MKRAMIVAGHGWGGLPGWLVENDLESRKLKRFDPAGYGLAGSTLLEVAYLYRSDHLPGPLGQRVIEALKGLH